VRRWRTSSHSRFSYPRYLMHDVMRGMRILGWARRLRRPRRGPTGVLGYSTTPSPGSPSRNERRVAGEAFRSCSLASAPEAIASSAHARAALAKARRRGFPRRQPALARCASAPAETAAISSWRTWTQSILPWGRTASVRPFRRCPTTSGSGQSRLKQFMAQARICPIRPRSRNDINELREGRSMLVIHSN